MKMIVACVCNISEISCHGKGARLSVTRIQAFLERVEG